LSLLAAICDVDVRGGLLEGSLPLNSTVSKIMGIKLVLISPISLMLRTSVLPQFVTVLHTKCPQHF